MSTTEVSMVDTHTTMASVMPRPNLMPGATAMVVCPPMSTTEVSMVDTPTTTASVTPRQNQMLGAMAMEVCPPMSTTEVSMVDTPTTMESVMLMPSPMHTFTDTPMVVSTVTLQFTT